MANEVNRTPRAGDPSTAELEEEGRRQKEEGRWTYASCSFFPLPSSLFPSVLLRFFQTTSDRPAREFATRASTNSRSERRLRNFSKPAPPGPFPPRASHPPSARRPTGRAPR